ncbi:MAG: T9SS type A sorting domain-containing protein [Melioribacteraceae bacterium]|nr:T9SS type A sorting domain-containing protein [Melioribacteraceae bacterium]
MKTDVEDELHVNKFNLNQNYPNPFNPTTIINYELKALGHVKLMVYNILGKEVAELVNEKQYPGRYKIKFNGAELPSGVYFYRLIAGNFVDTKSMVLIK